MKKLSKTKNVYLYEIWWTGNGGIPCDSEYCSFDHKPDSNDIEQECINTFGSPNDFPQGWRGFKYKKLKIQDIKLIIDKFHKMSRQYNKLFEKHRASNKLMCFYLYNPLLKNKRN